MPTQEQIEVGSDILREEVNALTEGVPFAGKIRERVTDQTIREIVTKILTGAENVLGRKLTG